MKSRFLLAIINLLFIAPAIHAQAVNGLFNGDMEQWRHRQFRCCGRNVDLPVYWGIPEQSCGLNQNKFVFLETDSFNVHSGQYSAMLYSDTTYVNNVGLEPGILAYGAYQDNLDSSVTLGQPVHNFGYPIDSNPLGLSLWIKMSHDLSDTFSYTYLFTRWDSVAQQEDTLAYATKDIPDTQVPQDQWFSYSDSIHYLHAGKADTTRLIFYGGRFGNTQLRGNRTWIDDVSFYYTVPLTSTGISEPAIDRFAIYPNPASNMLHIKAIESLQGDMLEISDDLGRVVSQTSLEAALSTIDISKLARGYYICHVLDASRSSLYQAKLSIVR